jgi:protein involved in polysaccharide export with SLBB domain
MQSKTRRNGTGAAAGLWLAGLALVLWGFAPQATAQQVTPYEYARPGRPTMTLYVWGAVSRPGIWEVEEEIALVELLSLVNVQAGRATREGVREERFVRIYRGGARGGREVTAPYSARQLIFDALLEEVLKGERAAPALADGDILVLEVETHERVLTFRNVSSFIGTAASLTLLIIRLASL